MSSNLSRSATVGIPIPEAWLIMGFGAIVSAALVLCFPDDLGVKIAAMVIFWLVSVTSVRLDITHPFVWFGGPFLLYSISGPLLIALDMHPFATWGGFLIRELNFGLAMDLQYWGLVASFMVIGPKRINLQAALHDPRAADLFRGVLPLLAASILLTAFAVSEILAQGFTQKIDTILYGSWSTRFSFGQNILCTCLGVYLAKHFIENRPIRSLATIAGVIALALIIVLLVGQRDFLFRVLIVSFFAYHIAWRKISLKKMIVLFLIAGASIPILGGLKMMGNAASGSGSYVSVVENIIDLTKFAENLSLEGESQLGLYGKFLMFLILSDEFRTAGDNLAMLVTRMPEAIPFQYGYTLINDLLYPLRPGFLQIHTDRSAIMYNAVLFPVTAEKGGGMGFTLVGAGYLNFGIAGAIMIMVTFGAAIRSIYRWAGRSAFGLFFMIGFLPISFSVARNDLSAPLSVGLKHVLLPLVAMLIIAYMSSRDTKPTRPGEPAP